MIEQRWRRTHVLRGRVVPVVVGEGVRFFGGHTGTVLLDDLTQVVRGDRVLHLHYRVERSRTS